MNTVQQMVIRRTCACGCGQSFIVPRGKPGWSYLRGHKPKPDKPKGSPVVQGKRSVLDYRIALKTAEAELARTTVELEAIDEALATARQKIEQLDREKENVHARHLTLSAAIECLKALATDGIVDVLKASC